MNDDKSIFIDKGSKWGILMLHGFTSTPKQFKELAEFLASQGFTVYAPIVAGHGTTPEDLMNTTCEDWKSSIKNAYLNFKTKVEKIILIGNSFGSNLSLWLAKETNNDPLALILLGTPIYLRFQRIIKLRLNTYGKYKKFYKKPKRIYTIDYTDMKDEVSYPVIPIKSLFEFFHFVEKETMLNLDKVKVPVLIAYATGDMVINTKKSANFIFSHLASSQKEIFWYKSRYHAAADGACEGLFPKIYDFIQQNIKNFSKEI